MPDSNLDETDSAAGEARYVVTLVHGTWGSKSPFLDADGPLQTRLRHDTPNAVVSIFPWSGRNRMSSRLEAAANLGDHLKALHKQHPRARHFVVAHSHGGTVALYALKDPEVDDIVSGVICFATPFINVSRRAGRRTRVYDVALPVALSAPLAALSFAGVYGLTQVEWGPLLDTIEPLARIPLELAEGFFESSPALAIPFLAAALLAGVLGLLMWPVLLTRRLYERWVVLADHHYEHLRLPTLQQDRLLIIRTAADEATAAIAFTQFIAWTLSMVYEFSFRVVFRPVEKILSIDFEKIPAPAMAVPLALGLGAWILLLVMSVLVSIPVAVVMMLSLIGGVSYGSTAMLLEFSAENSPPGSHTVHLYDAGLDESTLVHSASYLWRLHRQNSHGSLGGGGLGGG